jgi:hypothetical protein
MKSLTIRFNNKAALNAAQTYLVNQTAPFRNSSVSNTVGVDVNTEEKFASDLEETFEVTLPTETWANRAERELTALFADPNNSTCGVYTLTR